MAKKVFNVPVNLTNRIVFLFIVMGAVGAICSLLRCKSALKEEKLNDADWPEYNSDGARSHYSALNEIKQDNLDRLIPAWEYASGGADTIRNRSQMQCNPVVVNGVLYAVSAGSQVFALDAETGKELWKTNLADAGGNTSRGITYFSDSVSKRIFYGGASGIYAIDAETGKLIHGFGDSGRLDIRKGIERPGSDAHAVSNTPNTIYKNLLITGAGLAESESAMLGDIRAYNVYTGDLVWVFKTIPDKADFGYDTWPPDPRVHNGGANAWAGMAIDRERGIVYAPTGSAAFDFYGGNRRGENLFANCLIALDAATGKRLWHFQFVHHDIWDRDLPAPPNLLTINFSGTKKDVVAQVTKQGHIFVFDRVTGEPIFPIEERIFPTDGIKGEFPHPTQPIPLKPSPFTRQTFTEKDFSDFVADKDSLVQILKKARTGSPYIPVTEKMTIFFPGTDGGAQWGGAAVDRDGILYVPAKEIPCYTTLVTVDESIEPANSSGEQLYQINCSSCHGKERRGNHDGSYPSLVGISGKLSAGRIEDIILKGKGMMPSFSHLSADQTNAVMDFLAGKKSAGQALKPTSNRKEKKFRITGYNRWYDSNGYPVIQPPWGTLTAIDLNSGEQKWQIPLGEYPALMAKGVPPTGTDNYGGPLVTGSGLIFIAASRDEKFRVIDKTNGKILWEAKLPAAGYASPTTYAVNGKQFVVIACGGGKLNTGSGDKYLAFSLAD